MVPLAAVPGLLLTTLLPGWLLVRAIWPEERVRGPASLARTLGLSLALSIAVTIVVASALGFLPHGETGFFRPWAVAAALLLASLGLFGWGARRGAFPRLAGRLARVPLAGLRRPNQKA